MYTLSIHIGGYNNSSPKLMFPHTASTGRGYVMNIGDIGSIAAIIGGGFFAGILIGYALKKVAKLVAVVVGLVSETKYGKTRSAQMKTSVFATSNNIKKISCPLKSRFFIVELKPYTFDQFCEIARDLLQHHKVEVEIADLIAGAVWNKSRDIRDCVRIGTMAKSIDDVTFLVDSF